MHPNLSFEQAPPISVPYRFFLTAPWFGVLAGLLLAWQGGDLLSSRWLPATLAATHLLVVGFMLQAMSGAVMQFIPVAAGGNIWRPRQVAAVVHPLATVSAILLAGAFLSQKVGLFIAAAHGFLLSMGAFVVVAAIGVWQTPARGATIIALRLALIGLAITIGLGATLALGLAYGKAWPLTTLTDVHAAWGLGGWGLVLLAGVSYYVVPMFQLTPAYPAWLTRSLPWLIAVFLLAWSTQLIEINETLRLAIFLGGLLLAASFAAVTLFLQSKRRRKIRDITLLFFRVAMICLLIVLASGLFYVLFPALREDPRFAVWLGVVAIPGVFVTAINGMLYKIVPFLNWLHLQRISGLGVMPPTMKEMIGDAHMQRQYIVHMIALALLFVAVWLPMLARPAGVAFAVSCGWLGVNLVGAVRVYRRFKDRILAAA